ncbi:hypothetical protein BKA70DRAFT_1416971 [Coprinopsis sp. MPI-PUGE-AT-0042]|nr:hypothetical protein BKA70DRAFT_1416971 [Coprinopsis sp. MPI-PUGE-AT-0042]
MKYLITLVLVSLFSLFTAILAADSDASLESKAKANGKPATQEGSIYGPQMSEFANKGHIGIHRGDTVTGAFLGYLSCHKVAKTKRDAILYGFNVHGPLMEITALTSDERMAVVAGQLGNNLLPASPNFHHARHTRFTSPAGAGLHHDVQQAFLYQTTVFSYDPNEEEIQIEFLNTDGSYVDVSIVLMGGRIFYTGDVKEFKLYSKQDVERVTFKWYPLSN